MNRRGRQLRLVLVVWCVFTIWPRVYAAAELAPGLVYLRPTAQPEWAHVPAEATTVVLDLRQVAAADNDTVSSVLAALKVGGIASNRMILALVSPVTPRALRTRLAHFPRCITVGRTAPDFSADITVEITAEAEQRALAALAAGTAPETLLVENLHKTRYDESVLAREQSGASELVVKPETSEPDSDKVKPHEADTQATDGVLLQAVQIYRGLVALKKL